MHAAHMRQTRPAGEAVLIVSWGAAFIQIAENFGTALYCCPTLYLQQSLYQGQGDGI